MLLQKNFPTNQPTFSLWESVYVCVCVCVCHRLNELITEIESEVAWNNKDREIERQKE